MLRWHVRNYQDEDGTVGHLVGDAARDNIQAVLSVADSLGLEREQVKRGYRITKPIDGAKPFTNMDVRFEWSVASGFAHGRPWAYQGLLKRRLTVANGHDFEELTPRTELSLWLPLQALHLLGELLRMRELRAGYMPSAPPPP